MSPEDKLDALRALANGTTIRKKLYFNPAYFEPHLLLVSFFSRQAILMFTFESTYSTPN